MHKSYMACAITGASGYVGSRFLTALGRSLEVVPISRRSAEGSIRWEMGQSAEISRELREREVRVLVHAAWDFSQTGVKANEQVNVEGSRLLFESAEKAGVERIIFVSTISAFSDARSIYVQSNWRVEQLTLARRGGVVVRPGLIWGDGPGGMFGALAKQVRQSKVIPLIGSGRYPQYLLHEDDLAHAILGASKGEWTCETPVTLAHARPWLLRELIQTIARRQAKDVKLLPVPWPAVYAGLKAAELLGVKMKFRSDSVLSLVFQNPAPDFSQADRLHLERRPYLGF